MFLPAYFFQGFAPWWAGLHWYLSLAHAGQPAFLLGRYAQEGWWYYFPVAFLMKTPVGSLVLIGTALAFPHLGTALARHAVLFLLAPVTVIFVVMSQSKINIGLRHILPVYPLLFVFASRAATIQFRQRWLTPLLLSLSLVATAFTSLKVAPHQLAYFNELIGGPPEGYRYLSDSNVDWGQDPKGVKEYMEQEGLEMIYLSYFGSASPSYYKIHYQNVPSPERWQRSSDVLPQGTRKEILAISVVNGVSVFFLKNHTLRAISKIRT